MVKQFKPHFCWFMLVWSPIYGGDTICSHLREVWWLKLGAFGEWVWAMFHFHAIPHSFSSRRSRVNFPKTRKFKEHLVPRLFPTSFRISTPAFSASSFNLLISGLTWAIWGSLSTQNLYGMIFLSSVEPTINQRGLAATQLPILAWIDPLTHSLARSLTHSVTLSLSINQSINLSIYLPTYLPS